MMTILLESYFYVLVTNNLLAREHRDNLDTVQQIKNERQTDKNNIYLHKNIASYLQRHDAQEPVANRLLLLYLPTKPKQQTHMDYSQPTLAMFTGLHERSVNLETANCTRFDNYGCCVQGGAVTAHVARHEASGLNQTVNTAQIKLTIHHVYKL